MRCADQSLPTSWLRHAGRGTLLALCLAVQGVHAADFTVTRTNISGPGSLQAVIAQVNATPGDHTLRFGVTGTIIPETPLPTITRNLVIEGREGLVLSGGGKIPLLSFGTNVTASLTGLVLVDGYSTNGGAAIWNAGKLVIERCRLSGNKGGVYGGAVFNGSSASLEILRSTLSSNTVSPGWGGGVYNAGELVVSQSTFVGNVSKGGDGGRAAGLVGAGGGGAGLGGAAFIDGGSVSVKNSPISGNGAVGGGGGQSSGFNTGGGPFGGIGNGGDGGFGSGGAGGNGRAGTGGFGAGRGSSSRSDSIGGSGIGGGIFVRSGTLAVISCTIISNRCFGGPGGVAGEFNGKAIGGGVYQYGGQIHLANTIIELNQAADASPDLQGTFQSSGYNIIGNNSGATGLSAFDYQNEVAALGPLQDNGGGTLSHAPLAGSLAIDTGTPTDAPEMDQRGVSRPQGTAVDIGAVEFVDRPDVLDADGDGLSDADEVSKYHTDPRNPDSDGDGFSDGEEILAQAPLEPSNPNDATSVLEVLRVYAAVELNVFTNKGRRYQLEASDDLGTWKPFGDAFDGVGGKSVQLLSTHGTRHGFWRVVRLP